MCSKGAYTWKKCGNYFVKTSNTNYNFNFISSLELYFIIGDGFVVNFSKIIIALE